MLCACETLGSVSTTKKPIQSEDLISEMTLGFSSLPNLHGGEWRRKEGIQQTQGWYSCVMAFLLPVSLDFDSFVGL